MSYPFRIDRYPAEVSRRAVRPGEDFSLQQVDDKRITRNVTEDSNTFYSIGLMIIGTAVVMLFAREDSVQGLGIEIVVAAVGLFCFIYAKFKPVRTLTLDREAQTITVPPVIWGRHKTIPFTQIKALHAAASVGGGVGVSGYLGGRAPGARVTRNIGVPAMAPPRAAWSFMLWYMDKNRPLPPSEALDPYRERDDARRAAEGNPPPLFPADIDTDAFLKLSFKERSKLRGEPKAWREDKSET